MEQKEKKRETPKKKEEELCNIYIYIDMLDFFCTKKEEKMFTKVEMHIDHLVLLLSFLLSLFLLMNNLAI